MPRSNLLSLPPAIALLFGVLLAACGEDGPPPPASIEGTTALAQTGTVGAAVAVAPAVLVEDAAGNPLPGARVTFGVVSGGGTVTSTSVTTNMTGRASAGAWTLGPMVGEQVLQASAGSLAPVRFTVQAGPGAPATLTALQGDGQMGIVGSALTRPSVRVEDGFGNPAQGTQVNFQVTAGDGSVSGANVLAGADGTASPAEWRLGGTAGLNTLSAGVSGLAPVEFTATGERGPAAQALVFDGDGQSADAGQAVPIPPTVLVADAFGNGVEGATVVFEVESGGGSVTAATAVTDGAGLAAVGSWILGPAPTPQTLIAVSDSVPADTVRFTATLNSAMIIVAGDGQTGEPGNTVDIAPTVQVLGPGGGPAANVMVTFAVTSGGGSVAIPTVMTDAGGLATVGSWQLGAGIGAVNTVEASAPATDPVTFTATASDAALSDYDIEIRFITSATAGQQQAFADARRTWRLAITGDVPAFALNNPCGGVQVTETVDDLLILAQVAPIDGPGGILGGAGPCWLRPGSGLPIVGIMIFDAADLDALEMAGLLDEVIEHEMGHVLGIGTLWVDPLLVGAESSDPFFVGAAALAAFDAVGGAAYTGNPVPVENTGEVGDGSRDVHWRESVLDNELMTPFLNGGVANPLSIVSIASLEDLGYVVDLGAADPYALPSPSLVAERARTAVKIQLREARLPPPRTASEDARVGR